MKTKFLSIIIAALFASLSMSAGAPSRMLHLAAACERPVPPQNGTPTPEAPTSKAPIDPLKAWEEIEPSSGGTSVEVLVATLKEATSAEGAQLNIKNLKLLTKTKRIYILLTLESKNWKDIAKHFAERDAYSTNSFLKEMLRAILYGNVAPRQGKASLSSSSFSVSEKSQLVLLYEKMIKSNSALFLYVHIGNPKAETKLSSCQLKYYY